MSGSGRVEVLYRVPYADTDQMQVVYYANYLVFFERGRNELLRAMGCTYRELEAAGSALPVLEAHVNYLAPARYDDLLVITTWIGGCQGVRIKICCEVRCADKVLAEGYTLHAHVDARTLRPKRPSEALRRAMEGDGALKEEARR